MTKGAGPATVEDAFRGNPRDIPDALIVVTLSDASVLVTGAIKTAQTVH